jgi:tRNA/rRNA methyltransferase
MPVRIVLSHPSHPGNIGAAARAMKTMGYADLVLVAPRHFPDPDAIAMAAGAADVLAIARVCDTLEAALADCTQAAGFSARGRELSHPARGAARGGAGARPGGRRRHARARVRQRDLGTLQCRSSAMCQRFVSIPANPAYGSLNLAAAVQVACYELATTTSAHAAPTGGGGTAATGEDIAGLFQHLESSAVDSGFLDPARPGRFMERMRRLFARSGLEREEVKLIRGLLAAFEARMK